MWKNTHREPHVSVDSHEFLETFSTYEDAKESAEKTLENEGDKSPWYFDYQIYEEVNR